MPEATQPIDLPGTPKRVIIEQARIKQVAKETFQLQEKFVTVLTHTKILFTKKESRSDEFLSELRITLTTLPLPLPVHLTTFLSHPLPLPVW